MLRQLNYIFNKNEKIKLALLLIMVVVGSFLELLSISLFQPFSEILMNAAMIYEKDYLRFVYETFQFGSAERFLIALAIVIAFVYVVKNLYLVIQKNLIYKFSFNIQKEISTKLLVSYMRQPYTFHLKKNIAVMQRSIQEDADLFARAIINALELLVEIAVCLVLGVYLFYISRSITVIVVSVLLVCVAVFYLISKKYSTNLGKKNQEYKGMIFQWMNQSLGGIKEIKILGREQYFVDTFEQYFGRYAQGLKNSRLIGVIPKHFIEMFSMAGLMVAVIIKLLYGYKEADVFVTQLAVFAAAAFRLLPSVGRINEHSAHFLYALPSIDLIYNDLKAVAEIPPDEKSCDPEWKFTDTIKIRNVRYRYPGTDEYVIDGAQFEIKKGTMVAFIGTTGAGKTTMADIIIGLLAPEYGRVIADNLDIHKNLSTWHKEIGYIPQTIYLSDDTIRHNVAFGLASEHIDEQAVVAALEKAQLYKFVEGLPDGLDTYVGDRGIRLSGGQRQRIGIARALYHNPEILVLDEATAALDSETEAAVMEAIESLHGEKTMIVIAHRLSTIKDVDMVYEIEGGKVIAK